MECSLFKRDWTQLKWLICNHRKISSYKDFILSVWFPFILSKNKKKVKNCILFSLHSNIISHNNYERMIHFFSCIQQFLFLQQHLKKITIHTHTQSAKCFKVMDIASRNALNMNVLIIGSQIKWDKFIWFPFNDDAPLKVISSNCQPMFIVSRELLFNISIDV